MSIPGKLVSPNPGAGDPTVEDPSSPPTPSSLLPTVPGGLTNLTSDCILIL